MTLREKKVVLEQLTGGGGTVEGREEEGDKTKVVAGHSRSGAVSKKQFVGGLLPTMLRAVRVQL